MSAVGTILSVFNPQSPQSEAVAELFITLSIICGIIFAVVTCLVFYCILRFRNRPGDSEPRQIEGNTRLEMTWTLIPFLLLVWIFFLTARGMTLSDPPADREPDLIVTGHQWWWEAKYPKSGVIAANEIHIPVGRKLLVRLESRDVIHDFWVAELSPKRDMIPGHPNHIWLQSNVPGTFLGVCAEYCGAQHAWMRFLVIAESEEEFEAWQQRQLQAALEPVTETALRGARLFNEMTCVNCHAIGGTGDKAQVAPDLTHLASRRTLGAGILANNSTNLARWLKNAQAVKPGSHMPNLELSDSQVDDLVNYFETLK